MAEKRLSKCPGNDPLVAKLLFLRGVGPVTAWVIRAEIGRFDRFRSGKQLSRFCGLSPRIASSGMRQADAGLVKAATGNCGPFLFKQLTGSAVMIRSGPRWSTKCGSGSNQAA